MKLRLLTPGKESPNILRDTSRNTAITLHALG